VLLFTQQIVCLMMYYRPVYVILSCENADADKLHLCCAVEIEATFYSGCFYVMFSVFILW